MMSNIEPRYLRMCQRASFPSADETLRKMELRRVPEEFENEDFKVDRAAVQPQADGTFPLVFKGGGAPRRAH